MKKRIKQIGFKTLAVLLSLLMIFYVLPSTVYAEWFEGGGEQTVSGEPEIVKKEVFELTDRREESVKHFRLEDGSIMAVQYADAVHRADENGTWQDIDNTLSSKGSEFTTSDARVKFAKKVTGNEVLFTLHEHNRKITMSLDGAKKKTAGAVTNTNTEFEKGATQLQKLMTLDKLSAKILYADILDGVDLEYVVVSNDIKENIIVKERKENYTYSFTISLNNLEAELTEVGSVAVLDPGSGETVYVIPAPVVYDANDTYAKSEDAFYTLTQSENKTYALSVTVNSDWMNEDKRAFPVVVDPTVSVATNEILDLDLNSTNPDIGYPSFHSLYISDTWRAYWKMKNLPKIPASAYIVNASVSLKLSAQNASYGNYIGVYQVLTDWNETLTWNKIQAAIPEGQLSSTVLDYNHIVADNGMYGNDGRFSWNITGLVKSWLCETSNNYGIGFALVAPAASQNPTIFYSTDDTTAANRPQFSVTYKDMKGVEPYWSFSSQNAGLAGTGYVNRATGSLTFTKGLLSTTDSLFPYTPTLVYNSSLVEKLHTVTQLCLWSYPYAQTVFYESYMPLGFKWNFQETLIRKEYNKPDGSESEFLIWSDADGTEHYFFAVGNSETEYADEDGLQLTLTYDEIEEQCLISDDSKTVKTFTKFPENLIRTNPEGWYLTSITDKNGNEISFTYNNLLQPIEICLTPNGSTKITFLKILYASDLPYVIWNEVSKDAVVLKYLTPEIDNLSPSSAMFLEQLVYAHGNANTTATDWLNYYNNGTTTNITVDGTVSYTYDAVGYLTEAKDEISDYRISYTYTGGKVTSVTEYGQIPSNGQDPELGQEIRMSYYDGYTEVRTSGSDDTIGNTDDLITRYTFDREGRAVGVYTTDITKTQIYGGSAGSYETEDKIKNNIKESVVVGGSATNYLLNGGFEEVQSGTAAHWTRSSARVSFSAPETGIVDSGGAFFTIQANADDSITQFTQLPAGTYTISMDVLALNCLNVNAYVVAESMNRNYTFTEEIPLNEYDHDIRSYVSTSFDAGSYNANGTENFRISVRVVAGSSLSGGSKTFKVNKIMLEQNIGRSHYSMIQYGNFEEFSIDSNGNNISTVSDYWEDDGNGFDLEDAGAPFGSTGYLSASITEERYLKQTFYQADWYALASYDEDEPYPDDQMTFTVSGFARGSGQVASANSTFRLRVDVNYYTGSGNDYIVRPFYFDFQNDCTDWQFVCGTFTTHEGCLVHSIDISCEFSHQPAGWAMFDHIAVFRNTDDSVVRYRYYTDDANSISTNPAHAVEYNPTLAGLVHVKQSGYYYEVYEYNNDRQLVRKANNRGELYEYTYSGKNIVQEDFYHFTYNGGRFYPYGIKNPTVNLTPCTTTVYMYNAYGQVTQVCTYEVEEDVHFFESDAPYLRTQYDYNTTAGSRIFGSLATEYTVDGQRLEYTYNNKNGLLLACVNAYSESGTCYTYDAIGRLTTVRPALYDGISYEPIANAEEVSYTYNNLRQLTQISTETTSYTFTYDLFGNAETIDVGNTTLAEYRYHARNGKPEMVVYGTGYAEKYGYDALDNLTQVWYTEDEDGANTVWTQAYGYTYTAYGQLYRFDDLIAGKSTVYKYDTSGRMTSFIEFDTTDRTNEFSSSIFYDEQGFVCSQFYHFNYLYNSSSAVGSSFHSSYFYLPDGMLDHMNLRTETTAGEIRYSYDAFHRLAAKNVDFYVLGNSGTRFTNTVEYTYDTSLLGDRAYLRVRSYTSQVNNTATAYWYSYDDNGNITQITDGNDVIQYQYLYDDLGQLIREDNRPLNKSYTYTYDNAGNRTCKKTYAFTTGTLGTVQSTQNYTYGDSDWGDLLTAYTSGNTTYNITYDDIGNPILIGGGSLGGDYWYGNVLEWDGRNLISVRGEDGYGPEIDPDIYWEVSYTYNDAGIRTSKTVDGIKHNYYLDGTQIIAEMWTSNSTEHLLEYLYDETGSPIGINYRKSTYDAGVFDCYFFEKNLQGDIIAIYNITGTKICTYTYDAWGYFITSVTSGISSVDRYIAYLYNPFHYRGYYYDSDTGFYYLNSRYYNPSWGRFLNADGYISTGTGLLGYNMFAYCNNNPVMRVDPTGAWPKWLDDLYSKLIGKTIETGVGVIVDVVNYDKDNADENKVYKSHYFSSYKGTLVIRHNISFLTSWAINGIIFLNHDEDEYPEFYASTINHEYGHILQEQEIGTTEYVRKVAIPSVVWNLASRISSWVEKNYYNAPWEYNADMRGGVIGRDYTSWANPVAKMYWRY